jgi:hypothetical protein
MQRLILVRHAENMRLANGRFDTLAEADQHD